MTALTRRTSLSLALGTALAPLSVSAALPKVTQAQFDHWLDMRGGLDGAAYWYSEGFIRPIADGGRPTSRMLGIESWITPKELRTPTTAVSISRKIFFFLEVDRDERTTDKETGKPSRPSIFAHQWRRFSLVDGVIKYEVESHDLRAIRLGGQGALYTVTDMGDQTHVNYGSYPVRPGPNGPQITNGEIYDYFDHGPRIPELHLRYQMNWVAANVAGQISNMHGWRYASFDDTPNAWLKNVLRTQAPLWMAPPKDMAEIEKLRATIPYPVPGLGL